MLLTIDSTNKVKSAIDIEDDALEVSNIIFSLKDIVVVWLRRRCNNVRRDSDPINTWNEFKKELKKLFYPEDAEYEVRAKLRCLNKKIIKIRNMLRSSKRFARKFQAWRSKMHSFASSMAFRDEPKWS